MKFFFADENKCYEKILQSAASAALSIFGRAFTYLEIQKMYHSGVMN
jgi:hypothetical protein